jgi:hypothetical protein
MADLAQILAGTSLTVTETFRVDGTPLDLDTGLPTLTLAKPDGTAYTPVPTVSNSWAGPPARSIGQYRFVLPAQADPYVLAYTLVGTIGGQAQSLRGRVEWLGDQLFTLADLRGYAMPGTAQTPFTDAAKYPDAKLQRARAATLARFTKALGFSPVPQHAREVVSVPYGGGVILKELLVTKVLAVTAGGVAQVAANFFVDPGGRLLPVSNYLASPWAAYGYGVVAVEYVHGWAGVDDDGRDAALTYAASRLNPSGFGSGTSYTTPDGVSVTYEPSEVGRAGFQRFTGIRDVDRWLNLQATGSIAVA